MNTLLFYFLILWPIWPLYYIGAVLDESLLLGILVLVYGLIYRPVVDYIRLRSVTDLERSERLKLFIPFYGRYKFFKELYFPKF